MLNVKSGIFFLWPGGDGVCKALMCIGAGRAPPTGAREKTRGNRIPMEDHGAIA